MGIEIAAIHVDHQLRGEESAADGTFVKELCESYGVFRFLVEMFRFRKLLRETAGMCKLSAVMEDMLFLQILCKNMVITVLATAHHAEDQLETVLMQVTKGSMPFRYPG